MGRRRGGLLGRDVLETDPVGPRDEVDEGLEAGGADRPGDGGKGGVLEVVDGDAAIEGGLLGVSVAYRPVQQQQLLVDLEQHLLLASVSSFFRLVSLTQELSDIESTRGASGELGAMFLVELAALGLTPWASC